MTASVWLFASTGKGADGVSMGEIVGLVNSGGSGAIQSGIAELVVSSLIQAGVAALFGVTSPAGRIQSGITSD